jgi:hypothetical protein
LVIRGGTLPLYLKKFFWSLEQGLWIQLLGSCSPCLSPPLPWGWGEHAWSQFDAGPSPTLSPVPQASLSSRLVVDCCACALPLSAISGSGRLLAGGCWIEVAAHAAAAGQSGHTCTRRCCSSFCALQPRQNYCSTHAAAPAAASEITVSVHYHHGQCRVVG